MRKLLVLFLIAMLSVFVLAGCGGESGTQTQDEEPAAETGKVYNLRIAAQESYEHNDVQSLVRAAEAIKEKTDGHVNLDIYPSNQLGDYTQVYDEVIAGSIDMACITIPSTHDTRVEMLTIPYLTTTYEEAKEVFFPGSVFFDQLLKIQAEKGVHVLALYFDGYMGVGSVKPIQNPMDYTDPSHKSLLIRAAAIDSYVWAAQAMGYNTTTIPYADLYPALQTGVCDGWVGGSAYVNYLNFRDVINYFVDARYFMELIGVIINADTWNSLPQEYQQIMTQVFQEEALAVATAREQLDDQAMEDTAAMGIEIYIPTDEELDNMKKHFEETVWPKYKDALGEELYNLLLGK
ncbi:MAG: TRAP transporter substrate-binding protein DctP [Clostridia bacterium]|nr:TRAP transporter substrate-binding protein DctP [Clostridia bacterium]